MKQMKIFVLFVFCVVEILAKVEARYMFDLPHAGVQPSDVKNVWIELKTFLDASDSKSSGRPSTNYIVVHCIHVNDSASGIIGDFCLSLSDSPASGYLTTGLNFEGNLGLVYGSYVIADALDRFLDLSCSESELTGGQPICLVIEGNRSRTDQKINCCAALLRDGKIVIGDFGCFSLNYKGANADGMMKAPLTDAKAFLDLLAAEEKRLPLK